MKPSRFYLFVRDKPDQKWRNSGEGPWNTQDQAEQFGSTEVGWEWLIAQGRGVREALANPLYIASVRITGPLPSPRSNTELAAPRRFKFNGSEQECPLHVYELGQRIANRLQELLGVSRRYHEILPEILDELVATRKGLR